MGPTDRPSPLVRIAAPPVFWLVLWQVGARAVEGYVHGKGNELLLPYPATVFSALLELAAEPVFWSTVFGSLFRVLSGMVLGMALGGLLAGLTCTSLWADLLLSPALRVIRATPVASFILLVILWTERTLVPVVISALMVIPVVWANLSRGIRETDPKLLEFAAAYRFSRWKTIRLIYLPSLRPYLLAAATTSMGLAWKSGIAAEVLCLPKSAVGTEIYETKLYLEIPSLFAWTAVVVALSMLLEWVLSKLLEQRRKEGKL